jgi:hypothetical protein
MPKPCIPTTPAAQELDAIAWSISPDNPEVQRHYANIDVALARLARR